jgi:ribosomal-protein-alanine N-acetyltransferase
VSDRFAPRLRPGSPDDLAEVDRLERVCFSDPWPVAALLAELEPGWHRFCLVAEQGGTVLGYLMAWRLVGKLHLLNLAVDPVHRRLGIGTALLQGALDAAIRWGLPEITLEVRQSNQGALRFYRRHRFTVSGRNRGYYRDTGEDAIMMTRDVG